MARYKPKRDFERRLVRTFKDTIAKLGLIETGALYDSIEIQLRVFFEINNDIVFDMRIFSEPYLKFLDEPYGVTDTWTSSPDFTSIVEDVSVDFVEWQIDNRDYIPQDDEFDADIRITLAN